MIMMLTEFYRRVMLTLRPLRFGDCLVEVTFHSTLEHVFLLALYRLLLFDTQTVVNRHDLKFKQQRLYIIYFNKTNNIAAITYTF